MIEKAPDAYRTISEVGEDLDLPQHVLRFWETRFSQIKPLKRGGGRRYYRPDDVELLKGIRHLLYNEGYTIKGVQRILKEHGPKAVQAVAHQDQAEFGPEMDEPVEAAPPQRQPAMPSYQPPPDYAPPPPPAYSPPPQAPRPVLPDAPAWLSQPPAPQTYAPPPPPAYRPPVEQPAQPPQRASIPALPDFFEPAPEPAAPTRQQVPTTVSYMRGGLKPVVPAQPVAPEPASSGIVLRRSRAPVASEEPAEQPDFLPGDGGQQGEVAPHAGRDEMTHGLSDGSRRALQSAMFELSECRRTIERVISARDR